MTSRGCKRPAASSAAARAMPVNSCTVSTCAVGCLHSIHNFHQFPAYIRHVLTSKNEKKCRHGREPILVTVFSIISLGPAVSFPCDQLTVQVRDGAVGTATSQQGPGEIQVLRKFWKHEDVEHTLHIPHRAQFEHVPC